MYPLLRWINERRRQYFHMSDEYLTLSPFVSGMDEGLSSNSRDKVKTIEDI